jgi:signal transduction histidine kinase
MNELIIFNVYLFYGLVFFTIGCVIVFRNFKFSQLAIASALPALATFGFIHALHEWSELYLILWGQNLSDEWSLNIQLFRIVKLLISFLALMWFAWKMLEILAVSQRAWLLWFVPLLFGVHFIAAFVHWIILPIEHFIDIANLLTRWIFGLLGGSLAGVAVIYYGRELNAQGHQGAHYFSYTGWALVCYALAAGLLTTHWGVWVPIIRTLCALSILIFLFKALKVFDFEYLNQVNQQQRRVMLGEKMRAIGELTSGIAHEIKTPLSYATLGCDLLENHISHDANSQRQLQRIRHGIMRASHISQEILNFARSNNENKTFDLRDAIGSALQLLNHRLKFFDVELILPRALVMNGDAIKLEEVFINLLSNAIDAAEQNTREVRKVSITEQSFHGELRICVTDWGGGMKDKDLLTAMSPFFTTKASGKGTGLGLSICQQIIQQHHGDIRIENGPNGLIVNLMIPGVSQ